jgi:FMN-dependent oxidoreductase (nitrilotriacetate monooxygenase family)
MQQVQESDMNQGRKIKLGTVLQGLGRGWDDWRHPDRDVTGSFNFKHHLQQTLTAERGKFDFAFIADGLYVTEESSPAFLSRLEPLTLLSALAVATSNIGLVGTLSSMYAEPFNVARQFGSLDHISGGRAAWNVVTTYHAGAARNFSRDEHAPHELRYRIADEFLDVVRALWDSWEAGAMVADKATGQFIDPRKLHRIDFKGEFFSVQGPLNLSRCPQGQPVIFQAGASDTGRNFAAKVADAIFLPAESLEATQENYRDIKTRAEGFGRNPDHVCVLPDASILLGATDAEAEEKYHELAALVTVDAGLRALTQAFAGHDFSDYDADAPFPDVSHLPQTSTTLKHAALATEEGLTLRELALRISTPRSQFMGSPERVADLLQYWFEERACDGFVLLEQLPGQLDMFVDNVVPILQRRGLFREEYEGATFRENLGVPQPANRHA